jgi:hypothetical protein
VVFGPSRHFLFKLALESSVLQSAVSVFPDNLKPRVRQFKAMKELLHTKNEMK